MKIQTIEEAVRTAFAEARDAVGKGSYGVGGAMIDLRDGSVDNEEFAFFEPAQTVTLKHFRIQNVPDVFRYCQYPILVIDDLNSPPAKVPECQIMGLYKVLRGERAFLKAYKLHP